MYKDILFLEGVKQSTRQNVLNFVKTWNSKEDYIIVHTSGSTGDPKPIKILKSRMKASAKATIDFFNLQPNQNILLTLSAEYIAGKMLIIRAIENKMTLIVAPLSSNPLLIKMNHKIHFSAFVPLQVQTILEKSNSKRNYQLIDKVIIGGGEISQTLEKEIFKLTNSNYATFGMTETISHIALRNITNGEKQYTALPNVTFKSDNENCLLINAPDINSTVDLETTDVVDLLNSKQFIWKGRSNFVINSGGIKIHPELLEKKIAHLLTESRYYFTSIKDNLLGEKLILKIESDSTFDIKELQGNLVNLLSKFEQPKSILIIEEFDQTKTGKVIRR